MSRYKLNSNNEIVPMEEPDTPSVTTLKKRNSAFVS